MIGRPIAWAYVIERYNIILLGHEKVLFYYLTLKLLFARWYLSDLGLWMYEIVNLILKE